MKKMGKRFSLF